MQVTVTCPFCDTYTTAINIDLDSLDIAVPIKCQGEACGFWFAVIPTITINYYQLIADTP